MSTANPTAFADAIIDLCFEGETDDTLSFGMILDFAQQHGLVLDRKPTPAELADPNWWGHAYGITADDESVTERTPEFQAMLPEVEEAAA